MICRKTRHVMRKVLVFSIIPWTVAFIFFTHHYNGYQSPIVPLNLSAKSKVAYLAEANYFQSDKNVGFLEPNGHIQDSNDINQPSGHGTGIKRGADNHTINRLAGLKQSALTRSNSSFVLGMRNQTTSPITSLVDIPTNFNYSHAARNIKYTILWFNPAEWIVRRNKRYKLDTCEFNNCKVTEDKNYLRNSSAVIFGISMQDMGVSPPVSSRQRNPNQVWIFYSLEPPVYHVFQTAYRNPSWHNTMNWSMTFNLDSDVFAPYGTFKTRHTVLEQDYDKLYAMKTKMALWVVSNCGSMSNRNEFVSALKAAGLQVDVYGSCGQGRYPGAISELIKHYKFYLSLENSFCKYYVTEKVLERCADDVITVIRGGADYSRLLPNDIYVDAGKFVNASSLAQYLMSLGSNKDKYIAMMKRKDKYYTLNEDDFGYPYAMCNLCKKLNTHDGTRKIYGNLADEVRKEGRCINPENIDVK